MTDCDLKQPGAIHPGALLRHDILPSLGLSVTQAAADLKVTRQTLHRILAGAAGVTPEMALRLECLTGVAALIWLALQENYDLTRVRETPILDIGRIPYRGLPNASVRIVERQVMVIWKNKIPVQSRRTVTSASSSRLRNNPASRP